MKYNEMIQVLYQMQSISLSAACDTYTAIVNSLEPELKRNYDMIITAIEFKPHNSQENCARYNWHETFNELYFTRQFIDMFKIFSCDPLPPEVLWVAYYCLKCILDNCDETGEAANSQLFSMYGKEFLVKANGPLRVSFLTSENSGR